MNAAFSEDVLALRDGAAAFLDQKNNIERLRRDGDAPTSLWLELAAVGLLGVTAAETLGGLGQRVCDALPICEEFGYSNLPEPAGETVCIIIPLLSRTLAAGDDRIARLVKGTHRIVTAYEGNQTILAADGSDEILRISPELVALYKTTSVSLQPLNSVDPWRKLNRVNAWSAPEQILAQGEDAHALYTFCYDMGATETAAELCGLAKRMIELATTYASKREQFGQAIGRFQAVKHLLANALTKLTFARPVVHRAGALMMADNADRSLVAAHAKIAASDAAVLAGETAIQVFGGMGYTYEAELHYFMKRAWALAGVWGSREDHLKTIEQSILAA